MGNIIFITGGARCGKSSFAERLLMDCDNVLFISTELALDEEMKQRLDNNRLRRNENWATMESYKGFRNTLPIVIKNKEAIILDCLTFLVSNMLLFDDNINWNDPGLTEIEDSRKKILCEIHTLIDISQIFYGDSIFISNEVGLGLVPSTPLGRYYRNILGEANQIMASAADTVYYMVSGIPLIVKGN